MENEQNGIHRLDKAASLRNDMAQKNLKSFSQNRSRKVLRTWIVADHEISSPSYKTRPRVKSFDEKRGLQLRLSAGTPGGRRSMASVTEDSPEQRIKDISEKLQNPIKQNEEIIHECEEISQHSEHSAQSEVSVKIPENLKMEWVCTSRASKELEKQRELQREAQKVVIEKIKERLSQQTQVETPTSTDNGQSTS